MQDFRGLFGNIVIKVTSGEDIFNNEFFSVLLYFSILSNLSKMSICHFFNIKLRGKKRKQCAGTI